MAYNPAEGNNPYEDEQLAKEWEAYHKRGFAGGVQKTPDEVRAIKKAFLDLLRKGATVTRALEVINGDVAFFGADTTRIGRKTIYAWRQYEPDFRRDWDEAYAEGTDKFEQRLADFAMDVDPKQIDKILRYRNPNRYSTSRQEITGANGGPIQTQDLSADKTKLIEEAKRLGIDPAAILGEAG